MCSLLLTLLLMLAVAPRAGAQSAADSLSTLRLNATTTRTVTPDYAVIRIAVTTQDDQPARAGEANRRIQAAIHDTLRALGVTEDSTGTGSYALQATLRDREGRVQGYSARAEQYVVVQDLQRIGRLTTALLAAGATEVEPTEFGARSLETARDSAYADAVRDVYHRARLMAEAAGGHLTGPVELNGSENHGRIPCPVCLQVVRPPDPTLQVAPGAIAIHVNVVAVFHFRRD